jgi:hypothetical protein
MSGVTGSRMGVLECTCLNPETSVICFINYISLFALRYA